MSESYERIYRVVRRIPRGRVATYGQVARLAGFSNHARLVGYALHAIEREDIPWQRVINARGEVSRRGVDGPDELQRELLEDEGVEFDLRGRIDLSRFGWKRRTP
ncbi:MAG: MGMT family protein [Myxococcota bacterium]